MKNIWENIKIILASKIGENDFETWIMPLKYDEKKSKDLNIICPNGFFKNKIETKYKDLILENLKKNNSSANLTFTIKKNNNLKETKLLPLKSKVKFTQIKIPEVNYYPNSGRMLKPSFTFDKFVVGNNSELAYSATLSIINNKSFGQNSVFLYSDTGMGKSHLSQAAGHHILSSNPNKKFLYITANDFTSEMVHCLYNDKINDFKNKYRKNCDVLILENVHSLSNKTGTQKELVSTLDYLFDADKKVIFSSLYMPYEIKNINKSLSSRFSSSLVSSIEKPDFKTRKKILKKKEKDSNIKLSEEVIEYLADTLISNVRELESGLIGLISNSNLLGKKIDLALATRIVESIMEKKSAISVDYIKQLVCKEYGISNEDITSKSRKKMVVIPRQIAMFLSRKYTDQPLQSIGRSFNKQHATTMYAVNSIEENIRKKNGPYNQIIHLMKKVRDKL